LGSTLPKVLTPVAGRPMLEHLLDLYSNVVDRSIVVVKPGVEEAVSARGLARGVALETAVQASPTGMLDAILAPIGRVRALAPKWIWITWCDQVAVLPETVLGLRRLLDENPAPDLVLATCRQPHPYIHFERGPSGEIVGLRQRREGDEMPAEGESDSGLFVLSPNAYLERLPQFAAEVPPGGGTGERNFLPFIPWLAKGNRGAVRTVACREVIESIGINTPEELLRVEAHLARRPAPGHGPTS
jgi:bifunctional N-acetylglucosamine-1-phosphate-uridyltransferase/glucosamine-1-phosphate-acetyltransferase GlmU-like protein